MVVHTCNFSIQEAEVGGVPGLHGEFRDRELCIENMSKKKEQTKIVDQQQLFLCVKVLPGFIMLAGILGHHAAHCKQQTVCRLLLQLQVCVVGYGRLANESENKMYNRDFTKESSDLLCFCLFQENVL